MNLLNFLFIRNLYLIAAGFFIPHQLVAQHHQDRLKTMDVESYRFYLKLSDDSDRIVGTTQSSIRFHQPVAHFHLDLVNLRKNGKGMEVESVRQMAASQKDDQVLSFRHEEDRLIIYAPSGAKRFDQTQRFEIKYSGIPADGLIISENKFGDRTFFGDNWPNRAHHWLPVVDHPSDKAIVGFTIDAPEHYEVIASGTLRHSEPINGFMRHVFLTEKAMPLKVVVIGVADLAVDTVGIHNNIVVSSWVFPQNAKAGFHDYEVALKVMQYFEEKIGPFPWKKLANVQSKTRYGGMENAGNIFYFENSVTGEKEVEDLIAHEIAHQWFGNSASEADWHHIWLSEGFATYFAGLYMGATYGSKVLKDRMQAERSKAMQHEKRKFAPIVDTTVKNYLRLLNPNSYEKGAAVLHMLYHEMGADAWWSGIRNYYKTFQYDNVLSADFQKEMETVAGRSLHSFFHQWLYRPGHPILNITWHYDKKKEAVALTVEQMQKHYPCYELKLDLDLTRMGTLTRETIRIDQQKETFYFSGSPLEKMVPDPDQYLYCTFEIQATEKQK